MEIAPATDPDQIVAADLDQDHLDVIAEEISLMDSTSDFKLPSTTTVTRRHFDLCEACAARMQRDPLGKDARRRFRVSPN